MHILAKPSLLANVIRVSTKVMYTGPNGLIAMFLCSTIPNSSISYVYSKMMNLCFLYYSLSAGTDFTSYFFSTSLIFFLQPSDIFPLFSMNLR